MRIVIAGGPGTGKSTLAAALAARTGISMRHTDDLAGKLSWSDASLAVSSWFDSDGPWVVEGVATPRALRKWLARERKGTPCDIVVWLDTPHEAQSTAQQAMAKGCKTVWKEVEGELRARGVMIVTDTDASALLLAERRMRRAHSLRS